MSVPGPQEPRHDSGRWETIRHALESNARTFRLCLIWLVALPLVTATWLLPMADRGRYAEEFGSELWEIAHVGGGRGAQVAYAARQVLAARRLRAGLRAPQRRGAVP